MHWSRGPGTGSSDDEEVAVLPCPVLLEVGDRRRPGLSKGTIPVAPDHGLCPGPCPAEPPLPEPVARTGWAAETLPKKESGCGGPGYF